MSSTAKPAVTLQKIIKRNDVQQKFEQVLGERKNSFIASLLSLNATTALAKCEPSTVLTAAMIAATLDLPIQENLGYAYIIPYKNKAQFQMGWKGFVQLAQRTGQYKTINSEAIHEGDIKYKNRLTGEFEIHEGESKSEKVIGYAAYFRLLNGFEKTLYMTVDQIKEHGKKYSQSYRKGYGLWVDDFEAMALKTVLKLLLSKWGMLSVDMQTAVVSDQASITEDGEIQYIDNQKEAPKLTEDEFNEMLPGTPDDKPLGTNPEEIVVKTKAKVDEKDEPIGELPL